MSKPQQASRCSQGRYVIIGLTLLFAGISVAVVQYKIPSILESVMATYGMTSATGSWLMSVFTIMGIFLSLPTGSLAKRFGPKTMLLVGCGVVVAGSIIGAFATSAWLMIASRAVEGVAFVFVSVAGPLAVERYVDPSHRGTVNGIWALWPCLGSFIGSTATPMVFEALGLTATWLAYSVVVVIAAVLVGIAVRAPRKQFAEGAEGGKTAAFDKAIAEGGEGERVAAAAALAATVATSEAAAEASAPAAPAPAAEDDRAAMRDYAQLVRPNALLFFFAWLVFNIELLAVLGYTPTFLQSQGMNASLSGFASSLPGLLSVLSSPVVGKLIDRTGRTKPFFFAAMLACGPATFLMLTQSGALLWVGALLMGLVGYGLPAAILAAIPQIAGGPKLMAAAMSCYALTMCLGEFLGSLVTPMLLGPGMTNWMLGGTVMLLVGLVGTVAIAFCKFK